MSLQLQEAELALLEYLVFVDGSPNWVQGQIEEYKEVAMKSNRSGSLDKPTEAVLAFIRRGYNLEPEGLYEKLLVLSPDVEAQTKVAMSVLREAIPGLISDDTDYKMLYSSKLMLLAEQYTPNSVFPGSVHLIKAVDSYQVGEDYGLSKVCSGEITVDSVAGDHETCVSDFQQDIASLISSRVYPSKSFSDNFSGVSVQLGT